MQVGPNSITTGHNSLRLLGGASSAWNRFGSRTDTIGVGDGALNISGNHGPRRR